MAGYARRPAARSEGLIVERLPGEVLVYDRDRDEAHCLHTEAAAVFDLLDGTRTSDEIAAETSLSEHRVDEVLSELATRHLLDDGTVEGDGISRRDLIHRGALTGAGVAGAALITSIAAPLPAAAQSPNGCFRGECSPDGRFCGFDPQSENEECFCFDTTEGARCLDFSFNEGPCDQQGGCPSGTFCVDDETCEGDGFNGLCWYECGAVPPRLQQSRRRSSSWFRRR
jgi:hypothetical protein